MNAINNIAKSPNNGALSHEHLALMSPQRAKFNKGYYRSFTTKVHPIATAPRRGSAMYATEAGRLRQVSAIDTFPRKIDFGSAAGAVASNCEVNPTDNTKPDDKEREAETADCSFWFTFLAAGVKMLGCAFLLLLALINLGGPAMMSLLALLSMMMFWEK